MVRPWFGREGEDTGLLLESQDVCFSNNIESGKSRAGVRFDEKNRAGYSPAQVRAAVIRGGLQQIGFLEDNKSPLVRDNQHQQPAYE